MTNEWGAPLDRNGYAPSIIQADTSRCYLCGRINGKLDRHEPFGGALRAKSKRMGMWVSLCHEPCHLSIAHKDGEVARSLKMDAQSACTEHYDMASDQFIKEFYSNYLEA